MDLTNKLDNDQRLVLSIALNYSRQIQISRKKPTKIIPPLLIIQGGAGAGKSLLIKAISQWLEKNLRQAGDDPDKPYVLITAHTGSAASNVDGMTLHSAFNFNFGNEFMSLGDKTRDEKREHLKNLKMVIVDELSLLKADMLYQLDLRLKELKQNTEVAFGGCSILLFGDILQLKPVMAPFIFEQPKSATYNLPHLIDPLWQKFKVLFLNQNHRQGEDRAYAEILNRIRTGEQTEADCNILKQRVRKESASDLPLDALYINCTNKGVNAINEKRLDAMSGDPVPFTAVVTRSGKRLLNKDGTPKKPKLSNDGSVFNTPLQYELNLKVEAKVMLTYNVDVLDSLVNGALGVVVGFETVNGVTKTILVHFNNPKAGRERRKKNPAYLQQMFPDIPVTPISRIEFRFNLSKNPTSQNDLMLAVQFPLKVSFACTCHKIQGGNIRKPDKLVVDITSVREAAQAYVMLSRVQALDQLYILNEFSHDKIYPWDVALEELDRLNTRAENDKEAVIQRNSLVITLNVRSLLKHHESFLKDMKIRANVIALQETWCGIDQENSHLQIPGYDMHLVSQGRGKGVVTYYRTGFQVSGTINTNSYQMSKVSGKNFDLVNVYRSQGANKTDFLRDLGSLVQGIKPCFIVGDFNVNFLQEPKDPIINKITSNGFKQIVMDPTHIEGGLLDHVYIRRIPFEPHVYLNFPFYSDHAAVSVVKP